MTDQKIKFDLKPLAKKNFKNFAYEQSFKVKILEQTLMGKKFVDILKSLRLLFKGVLDECKKFIESKGEKDYRVKLVVEHKDLSSPLILPLTHISVMTPRVIIDGLMKVLQSHQDLALNEDLNIVVGCLFRPKFLSLGRGIKFLKSGGNFNSDKRKTSIIRIRAKAGDELSCLPRAICVGLSRADSSSKTYQKKIADSRGCFQLNTAKKLCKSVGLSLKDSSKLENLHIFENHLNCRIVLVSAKAGQRLLYRGQEGKAKVIFILVSNYTGDTIGHADCITKMAGFLGVAKYCTTCLCSHVKESSV